MNSASNKNHTEWQRCLLLRLNRPELTWKLDKATKKSDVYHSQHLDVCMVKWTESEKKPVRSEVFFFFKTVL